MVSLARGQSIRLEKSGDGTLTRAATGPPGAPFTT
jgi:hypothetical protein